MQSLDAVSLEVLWNRLISIANDQARALIRVSFSTVIRETEDLSCGIFDADAEMVVQAETGTPGHINSMATGVKHFVRYFPPETLAPGDALITNNPWLTSGHKHDFTVVTPIFLDDRFVGLAASVGHVVDVGGRVYSADATEVFEEGISIPLMKIMRRGKPNEELFKILEDNVRRPEEVLGDIRALVSANEVGCAKVVEFMQEYGLDSLAPLASAVFARSEMAARRAIAALPNGSWRHEVPLDGLDESFTRSQSDRVKDEPMKAVATVTVDGDQLTVDYSGTSRQVKRGINVPFNFTHAYTSFAVKCVLFPELPNNAGSFRPVTVSAPEGCYLNARFPSPVAARHLSGYFLVPAVVGCLAQIVPERVVADSIFLSNIQLNGKDQRGNTFAFLSFISGGLGARPNRDGVSALCFPANVSNTSVEIIENTSPLFILKKELIADSAGAGKYRGGCGQTVRLRVRTNEAFTYSSMCERIDNPPEGFMGGGPGTCNRIVVGDNTRPNTKQKHVLSPDTEIAISLGGGGGFYPPCERDPQAVLEDYIDGLITAERAASVYGVAIDADAHAVDWEGTRRVRAATAGG